MKEKQKHLTMKELPVTERPYEKCEKNGAGMLSDAELLAIVIKTGTRGDKVMDLAVQLLNLNPSCQGLEGIMSLDIQDFQKIRGIGRVKAVQLAAVCELSRRIVAFFFHKLKPYIFLRVPSSKPLVQARTALGVFDPGIISQKLFCLLLRIMERG